MKPNSTSRNCRGRFVLVLQPYLLVAFPRHLASTVALAGTVFLASVRPAGAIIPVPGPTTYTQSFDALGTATVPWIDDSTVPGWIAGINSNNTPDGNLQANDGSDVISGLLNLGTAGAGDRALGSKATSGANFANIAFGVVFQNTSSQPLIVTDVTYTGELWRTNTTAGGLPEQWFTFHKISATPITDVEPGTSADTANAGTFTAFPAGNWSSPTNLPEAAALDGNASANRQTLSGSPNARINPGEYFMVRWVDTNRAGTDGYQAIDNVSITFSAAIGTNLANISTRLKVETGDNALIGGFIITGTQPKKVIIRATGPSLSVPGKLANPTLELYSGSTLLASNDDWENQPPADRQAVIDSTIPPSNALESALVRTLPANGTNYTAIVRGANNETGIGVVEAYDLDRALDSRLANISTRGLVQTGANVLIAGTIVTGTAPQKVLIRAIGPSLPFAGKLADPTLELRDANGGLVESNDNWIDSPNKQAIIDTTIPPGNNLEAAILAMLPASGANSTAIVRGANDGTGIGVVEIYALLTGQAAITTPANAADVGSAFMIEATATAPAGGTISSVSFYDGNTLLGNDSSSPYRYAYTNASVGSHALTVVAYDGNNNATNPSPVVNVNVVAGAGSLTRGPYLQMAAPTQITIRWRNTLYNLGRVRFGATPATLSQTADETKLPGPSQGDHIVTLTGLTPNTTYFYSVGAGSATLAPAGADNPAEFTFTTPPTAGTVIDTRIWVLGDAGTANANAVAVRDSFYTFTGARTPNLVLELGDNAYNTGTDSEFQGAVFNMYPTMLRKTPFWSCLGNHETGQSVAFVDTYPYFDIYTLPTAGEAGGVASGTEHYYSFNYGNIHFIVLDSMTASRAVDDPATPGVNEDGPMATWLRADLASTTATWIISFFHHPPYTKGSHNSDTETELVQMRQNFLPILEAGGVDMNLAGHSHIYERSFLLDGHYGLSTTLTAAMKLNAGDGRPAGNGAYMKPLGGGAHQGAVYVLAGSAGQVSGHQADYPLPAHFISLENLGSLVLDINGNRLDATFLRENGTAPDTFTIIKQ